MIWRAGKPVTHTYVAVKGSDTFSASFPKISSSFKALVTVNHERKVERETNKMQLIWSLLSIVYLNTFRAPLCPSSGEQDCVLPHMVFCTGCAGCGCVELRRRTPYAVVHSLVLLTMGIVVPETCWDRRLTINFRLVASCWFLSLPYICSSFLTFKWNTPRHLVFLLKL